MKPRLLDLFCKAGGAGKGYADAGFEVIGVDIEPQPNYPFRFHRADALTFPLDGFDVVHASPPCQHFSPITRVTGRAEDHPDLIAPIRARLRATSVPYVIENVERARRALVAPVVICGVAVCPSIEDEDERFVIRRHRLFESNVPLLVPPCACRRSAGTVLGVYGGGTRQDTRAEANPRGGNTRKANRAQARSLMEAPWMNRTELCQAIPPAYTELIGHQLMQHIRAEAA